MECGADAYPPAGWTKRIVPGLTALKAEITGSDTFRSMLGYMRENGMELAGADWCGDCRTACNVCSFAALSPDNVCENVRCAKEKGLYGCRECGEEEKYRKGFSARSTDLLRWARVCSCASTDARCILPLRMR